MIEKELIKKLIYTNPIALLAIKDKESINFINSFLPYSTGFEIECNDLPNFDRKNFKSIPNILDVSCDFSEKRFRIPNGLQGLICLFNICNELHRSCSLNLESGIHYHIDCTDIFNSINNQRWIDDNNDWIINRLKRWETAKEINSYAVVSQSRAWVRLANEHRTIEIRIGEMTFDYNIIVTRIIDCNDIVKEIKSKISTKGEVTYNKVDITEILNYLKVANSSVEMKNFELMKQELEKKRKELNTFQSSTDLQKAKQVINSRVKKFI